MGLVKQSKGRSRRDILTAQIVFPGLAIILFACGTWWCGNRLINGEKSGEGEPLHLSQLYLGPEELAGFPEREWAEFPGHGGFDLGITSPVFQEIRNGKYIQRVKGKTLIYTVLPELQQKIMRAVKIYRFPSCSIVALNPSTGRILALVDYSRTNPHGNGVFKGASYPAASIFKLITAAGVLEEGLLVPGSRVLSYGNPYRLHRKKMARKHRYRARSTTFKRALGRSDNVAFAIVTSDMLGWERLECVADRFKFNDTLDFDFPLGRSRASIPRDEFELGRCGAGFEGTTLNPVHAAVITATIANHGVMMRPYVVERVIADMGEEIFHYRERIIGEPISGRTASMLAAMMEETVRKGTSASIFRKYGRPLLKRMRVAGKTGSLWKSPPGVHYDWFVGFAPIEKPYIAVAVMIMNGRIWRVKGTYMAIQVLKHYFKGGRPLEKVTG